jgi:hypothetical protein
LIAGQPVRSLPTFALLFWFCFGAVDLCGKGGKEVLGMDFFQRWQNFFIALALLPYAG